MFQLWGSLATRPRRLGGRSVTAQLAPSWPPLAALDRLTGSETPRIATRRPPGRSLGGPLIRWARDRLEIELLGWQEWVLRRGLVRDKGRWSSRTVGVLVARQSGKTTLASVRALGGMVLFGEQVIGAAQNRDIALDAWRHALEVAEDAALDVHSVKMTNGREEFWIGRARYKVVSSNRRGGRGLVADLVIMDELREHRDWDGWAALEKTRRARPSSQVWALSTEGDASSLVLDDLERRGRVAAASRSVTDTAWFEWSAAPDRDRGDPGGWAESNPALGRLVAAETIASEYRNDPPEVFDAEVLCRRVASLRPWLAAGMWESCTDPAATVPDGAEVCFSLDAGPELDHATIGVGWRRPDGRVHVEAVESFPSLAAASFRLAELCTRWPALGVAALARSPSEAAARRATEGSGIRVLGVSTAEAGRAVAGMYEAVAARMVVHPDDPMTATHIAQMSSDGLARRSSTVAVDAAVAVILARWGTVTTEPAQTWVAF